MSGVLFRRSAFIAVAFTVFGLSGSTAFAASAPRIHISNNWAGYAATNDMYSGVSAAWTVSSSTQTDKVVSADAAWVGIGGISSNDLIQAGTQALVRNDHIEYVAWYEVLPDTQRAVALPVHPGDRVSVSIHETTPGLWSITISNLTTGLVYQNTVAYNSSHSSAEWIIERPLAMSGNTTGYLPLSNFGTVKFEQAQLTMTNGLVENMGDSGAQALIMGGTGSRLFAAPTDPQADSFTVAYLPASVSAQYQRDLKRTYRFQQQTNVSSRVSTYQQVNTTYVIHVIFGTKR